MNKIAIVINGDLTKNRQGQINSALLRVKYLAKLGGLDMDIYCIHEYDPFLLRLFRKSSKPDFRESYIIDGLSVNIIYKQNSVIDAICNKLFRGRSFVDKLSLWQIAKRFKDYDLICGHAVVGGKVAHTIYQRYAIPYSVTWHGSDIHSFPFSNASNKRLINNIIQDASSNVFVSMALLNSATSTFRNVPYPHILYNAPSSAFYKYSEDRRKELRTQNGVDGKKVVAFVGNIVNVKNVFTLPHIFQKVQHAHKDVVFWIIGDGMNRKKLALQFEELGVQCKFWGNQQPEMMPDFMNCIDVLVLPSKNESFGMVLVEAIACGANAVGSNRGGIPEVIGKDNCFDLDDNFSVNMANRINQMFVNNVIQTYNPDFNWESTAKAEKDICLNIINKNLSKL